MDGMIPLAYRPGSGWLHRLAAGWKLTALAAFSIAAMTGELPCLFATTTILGIVKSLSRIKFRDLIAGSRPLVFLTLVVVMLRGLSYGEVSSEDGRLSAFRLIPDPAGLYEALRFAWGLILTYMAGASLFLTTTTLEIRAVLNRCHQAFIRAIIRPLAAAPVLKRSTVFRKIAVDIAAWDMALLFALTLGFLPRIFIVKAELEDAWRARGGRPGFRSLRYTLPKLMERLLEYTAETAWALESRGYGQGLERATV